MKNLVTLSGLKSAKIRPEANGQTSAKGSTGFIDIQNIPPAAAQKYFARPLVQCLWGNPDPFIPQFIPALGIYD